jgi:hypothetical protein
MTERPYGVLTAVCAGNRHLLLIKWAVAPDGLITRLGDSGDEAGALMASNQQTPPFDITAIPIADASACKPVRTASGDLQIDRIGSSHVADGGPDHPRRVTSDLPTPHSPRRKRG